MKGNKKYSDDDVLKTMDLQNQVVTKWARNLEEGLIQQTIDDMRRYTSQVQRVIDDWRLKGGDRK